MIRIRHTFVLFLFLVGISLIGYSLWLIFASEGVTTKTAVNTTSLPPLIKTIKYRVEVKNDGNQVIMDRSVYITLPVITSRQRTLERSISVPQELLTDSLGNQVAKITFPVIAPFETKVVDVVAKLEVTEEIDEQAVSTGNTYLNSERFVESDDPSIQKIADTLKAATTQETARNTIDWVSDHLRYVGYVQEDRGALYALNSRKADCTEYMYLYAALARANQIPTRLIGGFIVETNKRVKAAEYHNWVEVYMDGAWRVVDPQNNKFLVNETDYIAMRLLGKTANTEFSHSQQLVYSDGQVSITML